VVEDGDFMLLEFEVMKFALVEPSEEFPVGCVGMIHLEGYVESFRDYFTKEQLAKQFRQCCFAYVEVSGKFIAIVTNC
jgi:hypothetical protein